MKYVVLTAAKNEEDFIPNLIESMIKQTILPEKWIIISDNSTDRTDEIVKGYSAKHKWIELLRNTSNKRRQFGAKVNCLKAGYKKLGVLNYDLIATMDADVTIEPDYFEFLINKFKTEPKLGVAGTPFVEGNFNSFKDSSRNIEHVSGACQFFRKECYEQVGGHTPIPGGGEDWVAVTTARMLGWMTRTFPEKTLLHHRKMGTSIGNILDARYKHGIRDYYLGNHPFWQVFRFIFQIMKKPYVIGGLLIFLGYLSGYLTFMKRPVSKELLKFNRRKQMARLYRMFFGRFSK